MQPDAIIRELVLLDGQPSARLQCVAARIPPPGQYLLAFSPASDSSLARVLFAARPSPDGFVAVPPTPASWTLGSGLHLRGPLGHGFVLPGGARRVGLIAFDASPLHLQGLLALALKQDAAVVLVSDAPLQDLDFRIEVQPLRALSEVVEWADYLAMEARPASLPGLGRALGPGAGQESQILIHAAMPCGALAECGACAIASRRGWLLACKDGPVFKARDLLQLGANTRS